MELVNATVNQASYGLARFVIGNQSRARLSGVLDVNDLTLGHQVVFETSNRTNLIIPKGVTVGDGGKVTLRGKAAFTLKGVGPSGILHVFPNGSYSASTVSVARKGKLVIGNGGSIKGGWLLTVNDSCEVYVDGHLQTSYVDALITVSNGGKFVSKTGSQLTSAEVKISNGSLVLQSNAAVSAVVKVFDAHLEVANGVHVEGRGKLIARRNVFLNTSINIPRGTVKLFYAGDTGVTF